MKLPLFPISLLLVLVCPIFGEAQKRRGPAPKVREAAALIVMDEALSVLRTRPSLYAESIQRLRRGRKVQITGSAEADGVRFLRVVPIKGKTGWIQADALVGRKNSEDEARFARLALAASGFDQIELIASFVEMYPNSKYRPSMLILFGDMVEDVAAKLTRDAASRISRREMAASGAPVHSYYLNFNMLDRYRRLGIQFLFNSSTRSYHYDGASWREVIARNPDSSEAGDAKLRLENLQVKLDKRSE